MMTRSPYLFAALTAVAACGAERLQGASPKLDLSIEQAKQNVSDVVDFGDVVQPATETRRITIANSGQSQLHLMNVKLSGDPAFTITTAPSDVQSGKSAAFNATFAPTDIKTFAGAVDFDTDDPKQAHVTIKLTGSGSNPNLVVCTGPIDQLGANCTDDGRIIDYGKGIEKLTKVRFVRMIAATSSEVIVHSVKLVGDTQGAFKVDAVAADTPVPGNGDLIFNVVFAPPAQTTDNVSYTANIVIESNDPNHPQTTVTLTAIGRIDCTAFAETKTQTQTPLNKVDVLFVIDNSDSMSTEQGSIKTQITNFINKLSQSQLDFRLAVTTTDLANTQSASAQSGGTMGNLVVSNSHSIKVISSTAPPAMGVVAAFQELMGALDTDGSGSEFGLLGAKAAVFTKGQSVPHDVLGGVQEPLEGARDSDFYRADARLAIVIVSDEDDGSSGGTAENMAPALYASYFSGLKADPDSNLRVVVIADPGINSRQCNKTSSQNTGTPRYHAFIAALGPKQGKLINFCDDLANSLTVSGDFIAQPDCTFDLDKGIMTVGPGNTITIEPNTVLGPGDWQYIPASAGHPFGQVEIDKNCPAQQSQLEIDYSSCLHSYDGDHDSVPDLQDNCECAENPTQDDANSDGIGDICQATQSASCTIAP